MIGQAKTVAGYIKEMPEERREALSKIRKLCKEILVGYEEAIAYGGPTYKSARGIEVGFASQKNQINFYCLVHEVMLKNKDLLKGFNHGKGVIRFSPNKVDFEIIRKILEDTVHSDQKPC